MRDKNFYRNYRALNVVICLILLCFLAMLWVWIGSNIIDLIRYHDDPEIWQAEKEQKLADIHTYPVYKRRFFQGAFWLCVLLASGGIVGYLMKNWGEVQQKLVFPFKFGENEVPVRKKDLALASTIAMGLTSAAQVRELNAGLISGAQIASDIYRTIGKSTNYHIQQMVGTPEQKSLPEAPQKNTPTFQELLMKGEIAPGRPLIFGYDQAGQSKTGTWIDLFSSAIGGVSGTGKTATLRSLISQSLISGQVELFWIVDYHYPHPKSLLSTLGDLKNLQSIRYAETQFQTVEILEEVNETIDRRLAGKEPSYPVKVLVIDEVLIVCRKSAKAIETILKIATESRKAGIYGLFSAQTWKAESVGGSEVRDCLTSRFAHKMQPKQANLLLQDSDQSKQVKTLTTGQALFSPVNGIAEVLTIPFCAPSDMQTIARMLSGENFHKAPVTQPVTFDEQDVTETSCEEKIFISEMVLTPEFCRTQREKFGLSLRDVAEKIGCHHNKIYRYEKGETDLSDDEKKLLWAVLTQARSQREDPVTPGYI